MSILSNIDRKIKTLENTIEKFSSAMESKKNSAEKLGADSLKLELEYLESGRGKPAEAKKFLEKQRELNAEVDHDKLLKLNLLGKLAELGNDRNEAEKDEIKEQQFVIYKKLNNASQALSASMKQPLLHNDDIKAFKNELMQIWKKYPDNIATRNYNYTSGSEWALKLCNYVFNKELKTGEPALFSLDHYQVTSRRI